VLGLRKLGFVDHLLFVIESSFEKKARILEFANFKELCARSSEGGVVFYSEL
jgi:hypothetical protein